MTASEMKYNFQIIYDNIASASSLGLTDTEISVLLTMAQHNVILSKLGMNNKDRSSVNETEKRKIEFSELVKDYATPAVTDGSFPNSYRVELPDVFLYTLHESVDLNTGDNVCYVNGIKPRVPIKEISEFYYNSNIKNPYRKPYLELVWRLNYERSDTSLPIWGDVHFNKSRKIHELILPDNTTVNKYYLRYLKRPTPIIIADANAPVDSIDGFDAKTDDIDCILDPIIHQEIVIEAGRIAEGITKDQLAYQIQSAERMIAQ